ncbi:Hsp70 family protein [Paenibacillus radicis (ex Gao et al. 2016)]|uniref:Chaperone protein DnaK n=1 Tax=Paenibacillus radicis (ex Gao et al. 2016) TaxID=1737354 RepID=A0A917LZY7_9BACL|nr:molecular chaperone HscC [Paenibacillus radicis (ex Gao et al. 2016)]GGG68395.1 molecular chaperone HscC [Paenibacillus radicis (ex Gao et al. 2016)]
MPIIGIDLGTTNSLVTCYLNDECVIIPNALGEKLTPSVVSVLDTGEIITGSPAKERLVTNPERSVAVFKRHMGMEKRYELGNYLFSPTELSALLLKALKADAESYLGMEVTEAVISVPAYFNDKQRRATKEAGHLAGLKVDRLINEPSAAAVAYGLNQDGEEKKLLIFDLGGGTFDVSVLDMYDQVMEIRAVAGDNFMGGEDFDEILIQYFLEQHHLKLEDNRGKWYAILKKQAEACKMALTKAESAEMTCIINSQCYTTQITAVEFEKLALNLLAKLKKPLQRALKDADISPEELDHVILVGGSTKMPVIRSFVARLFGKLPLSHLNPDEVVGVGAGIIAAMKERNESLREKVLTDVCPYTLGISVIGDRFVPIIERNTIIPYSKVDQFCNVYDDQTSITTPIFQGESRKASENLKLGEITVDFPPAREGEAVIDVRFTYDINGILEVEVFSHTTKEKKAIIIKNSDTDLTEEEIKRRLKEIENLKIHPREDSKNQLLLARGERLFEEALSDQRMKIARELEEFEKVLDKQNPQDIKKAAFVFERFIRSIEDWTDL